MLKWILGLLLVIGLLGGGTAMWLYYYVKQNANVEGTSAAAAYERVTEGRLRENCSALLEQLRSSDEINSDAQYKSMCECYADNMFEKLRDVPPDELDSHVLKAEVNATSKAIFEKCANQVGLN